jgi:hypothetical protein
MPNLRLGATEVTWNPGFLLRSVKTLPVIIGLQAREAEAFAAEAAGNADEAVAKLKEAVAIEDSIDDLSQPPYPAIPANELCGNLLLELIGRRTRRSTSRKR